MCQGCLFLDLKLGEEMIKVYTTSSCAYCKMVKQFLTAKGKDFEVINLDDNPEKREEAFSLSGALSVPITTDGKSVVVGWVPAQLVSLA